MQDTYDLVPKIPIHEYGAVLRTKEEIRCTEDAELDFPENDDDEEPDPTAVQPSEEHLYIAAGSVLFYVEDKQFMAASKSEKKPMSAWVRCHFVTGDKRSLWYTVLCSPKRLWDFDTYRNKKKAVRALFDEMFEVIEHGTGTSEDAKSLTGESVE